MLALSTRTLEAVDYTVLGAGLLALIIYAVRYVRRNGWRDPLAGATPAQVHPTLAVVLSMMLIYVASAYLLLAASAPSEPHDRALTSQPTSAPQPGSDLWHRNLGADMLAKLIASAALIAWYLHARRAAASPQPAPSGVDHTDLPIRPRARPLRILAIGACAALMILPACLLLQLVCSSLWQWLDPQITPPTHAVLQALWHGAWGRLGTLQLVASAVIVAALAEELFFRGVLLEWLWSLTGCVWPAIVLSAVAFGAVHSAQPQDVLPMVVMGIGQGYVRVRYRSLAACIIVHALFNAHTMTLALLSPEMMAV